MKRLLLTAMLGTLTLRILVADVAGEEKLLFEEKFSGELDKDWSWVRERPGAWRIDQGALVLLVSPGYLHAKANNSQNVLLRPLPKSDGPLAIEVYVEGQPKVQFEHAGVVWYIDDDNYVSLFQEALGSEVMLQMVTEKDGKPRTMVAKHSEKGVWFRLLLAEGKITASYKPADAEAWKVVGQSDVPQQGSAQVGLTAGGAPKDGEREVRFRDFRILEIVQGK
jgi:regulation of enolase protein 1 (concanavalin A-like superfamily)